MTLNDLETFVADCYLDYAAKGIEVGDPSLNWHVCHHPAPKRLGGEQTILLLMKDHAIHGVIQSEVFDCVCCAGWEKSLIDDPYLRERLAYWQSRRGREAVETQKQKPWYNETRKRAASIAGTAGAKLGTVSVAGKVGSKTTNSQVWRCLVTGHETTSGALTGFQRKRGIDTSQRIRIS